MAYVLSPVEVLLHAFPGIPQSEAQELVSSGEVHTYPADTVLCQEDKYESNFYIILEGKVRVSKFIHHDQARYLTSLEEGDFFGEMALIHDAPRAATVITTTATTVLEIHKSAFDHLLRRSASLSQAMVREVSRRLRENDAMAIEDLRLKAGELANAYQRLAEQDYARREFLTTIAHELRTPLTAANGFLQLIQTGQLEGETLQIGLGSVSRNIQQIISLVNDILFLQEMDLILPNFQPVDLSEILKNTVENLQQSAGDGQVVLELKFSDTLPLIPGDAKSLERAFTAIIDNAIKFSPNGGAVQIEANCVHNQIRVKVVDYGVGIPEDVLPRIFDRFFHLDQLGDHLFRGAGLGLSIARHVIELHNGEIEVQSKLGEGSTVTVRLKASS